METIIGVILVAFACFFLGAIVVWPFAALSGRNQEARQWREVVEVSKQHELRDHG